MPARLVLASVLIAVTGFCTADDKKEEKKKDQDPSAPSAAPGQKPAP